MAGQPDLNYRNREVLTEMQVGTINNIFGHWIYLFFNYQDILTFWMQKGADGFRLDAIPHLMEDQQFLDEPPSNDDEFTADQWGYLSHVYTTDLPELYDVIFALRATVDEQQNLLKRPM